MALTISHTACIHGRENDIESLEEAMRPGKENTASKLKPVTLSDTLSACVSQFINL